MKTPYRQAVQKQFWDYSNTLLQQGVKLPKNGLRTSKSNRMRKLVRYMDRCSTGK